MKNSLSYLTLMYLVIFSFVGYGQEDDTLFHFDASKNNMSIGYDLRELRGMRSATEFGPMHIKYERLITKNVGLGLATYIHGGANKFQESHTTFPNGEILKYRVKSYGFAFVPKINWHFDLSHFKNKKVKKLDLYAGFGIGYGFDNEKTDYQMTYTPPAGTYNQYQDESVKNHYVATEFNLGARFYPTKHFGTYLEIGFGMSGTQFGLIYTW